MKKTVLFLAIAIFSATISRAQAPQGINYQAAIRDNSGTILANQSVFLRMSILQGSPSGTYVYQEIQNPTTSPLGLVNFVIGTGNVLIGPFSAIDWSNGPYFLQVEFSNGTPYQVLGTTQLVSVPYALYAQHSGDRSKAGRGITISNDSIHSSWSYYGNDIATNNNGKVGIGTVPNFQKLEVNGGVTIGNTSTSSPGAMRFTGADFEGYTGASWRSFTKASIDYFQYDNTTSYNIVNSTARNTMVLSTDSLIVPATGNYLILYTGKGNNPNSFDLAFGIYDTEGRTGVVNVTQSMNWVGGTYALFYGEYTTSTSGTAYRQYIPQTFSTSTFATLNAGDVLKAGGVVLTSGSPTGNWILAPFKIQLIKLN